jgi:hypothetical protein
MLGYFLTVKEKPTKIIFGGKEFRVEVANTMMSRSKGLSGHTPLADDEGMLFLFGKSGNYGFWMKDMKFPIDIIWIDGNKITTIAPNVPPDTYPSPFYSDLPSDKVLEINAGTVQKLGVKVGDEVKFIYN